jgi:hypothetical protein
VVIQWSQPPNTLHSIRGYSIQIKNSSDQWVTAQTCASANMICSFDEQALLTSPYNIHSGMVLAVRVAASNDYGQGVYQEE